MALYVHVLMTRQHIQFTLGYTRRRRDALEFAEKAHRGTKRKTGDKPYLLHPIVVSQILEAAGADDDLVIAAYLHDVSEDTGVSLYQIEDRFGTRVARLVAGVTKADKATDGRKLTSAEKSEATEQAMRSAHSDVCALKAADLHANVTDLVIDQEDLGYEHWDQLFGQKAENKLRHYSRLGALLVERLEREDVYPELASALSRLMQRFNTLLEGYLALRAA